MSVAVSLREDYSAASVWLIAIQADDASQARRLLSIAAIYDGMSRADAAKIGGMDRQTLRDWVHRFNAEGPDGLVDRRAPGVSRRLSPEEMEELARIVEAGPDPEKDGVVRWRCVDLQGVIRDRFGQHYHERSVGKLLVALGFSHISARPHHPGQNAETVSDFKKTSPERWRRP